MYENVAKVFKSILPCTAFNDSRCVDNLREYLHENGLRQLFDAIAFWLPSPFSHIGTLSDIKVCGERNTGTNFVQQLMNTRTGAGLTDMDTCAYNMKLRTCHEHHERLRFTSALSHMQWFRAWWKHDFAPTNVPYDSRRMLVVYMVREVADWVAAMQNRPYELENQFDLVDLGDLLDKRLPFTLESKPCEAGFTRSAFVAKKHAHAHRSTTLLQLRASKFYSYMQYARRGHPCVFVSLQFAQTRTEELVHVLATAARMSVKHVAVPLPHTKTGRRFQTSVQADSRVRHLVNRAIRKQGLEECENTIKKIGCQYWHKGQIAYDAGPAQ